MAEEEKEQHYGPMQTVKRRFFAMRNGVIADVLRKGGSPFRTIFGLNLPQIAEIAADTGKDAGLARQLWANGTTRESMLLAPMLFPAGDFAEDEARRWIAAIEAVEVADVFCHRLLRHTPYAADLAAALAGSPRPMDRYVALRTMFNLVGREPRLAGEVAAKVAATPDPLTDRTAALLREEVAFVLGEE